MGERRSTLRKRRAAQQWHVRLEPRIVWHYTYDRIEKILESGAILPPSKVTTAESMGLTDNEYMQFKRGQGFQADEKLVLFSERDDWEPASYRAFRVNGGAVTPLYRREQYAEFGVQVFRIGVNSTNLMPYSVLKKIVNMPSDVASALDSVALRLGSNPSQWWGSVSAVPSSQWEYVQMFDVESESWKNCATRDSGEDIRKIVDEMKTTGAV